MKVIALSLPDELLAGIPSGKIQFKRIDTSNFKATGNKDSPELAEFKRAIGTPTCLVLSSQEMVLKALNKRWRTNFTAPEVPPAISLQKGDTITVIRTIGLPLPFGKGAAKEYTDPEIDAAQIFVTEYEITVDPKTENVVETLEEQIDPLPEEVPLTVGR